MRYLPSILLIGIFLLAACQQKPQTDLSEFQLQPGLTISQVAAEPLLSSPVAMTEDAQGRLWVAEMPGYMRDIEGKGEDIKDGRIVILEDTDGDGMMDKRTIFLRDLLNPRAVALVYGGLLYTNGTALKWAKIAQDSPGMPEIVDSLYVIGGNIEHQPNGLLYNLDNWIYSAKSNARYRRFHGKWEKEATTFRGQWGISMDDMGRLIYNNNSIPIMGDCAMPNVLIQNPYMAAKPGVNHLLTKDYRVFPIQATAVNRGYQPGVLDAEEKLVNYTSACGPHIFYGKGLGDSFEGNAFVCAPEVNLIVAYDVKAGAFPPQVERKDMQQEFLVSTDESFRPINLYTGYDGGLYILDLRKGIIQHRAYMSNYLREKIIARGLDTVNGKGRIYKITSAAFNGKRPDLANMELSDLPQLLRNSNLQVRMFAQKQLVFNGTKELKPALLEVAKDSPYPYAQIHALWTLQGLALLTEADIAAISSPTQDAKVWQHLLLLSKKSSAESLQKMLNQAVAIDNAELDHMIAHIAGMNDSFESIWIDLAKRYATDPLMASFLVSGANEREKQLLEKLPPESEINKKLSETLAHRQAENIQAPKLQTATFDDDRTNGLKIFKSYCASCHGIDGKGLPQLAPSLASSSILKGNEEEVVSMILNGYQPEGSPYNLAMPSYLNDPNLSDQDIVDLLSYLKSTFTTGWSQLKLEQVKTLRKAQN